MFVSWKLGDYVMRWIFHIDFNSFFATVEQQANPHLRGKSIGVTGGDRLTRTVIGAASVEAKARGVYTGMKIPDALKICPDLILVQGDSDKYLSVTKKFLNILKGYSDRLEVFSIDEVFLEMRDSVIQSAAKNLLKAKGFTESQITPQILRQAQDDTLFNIAVTIKDKIKNQAGEWLRCSVGISYNKMLAKLAGSIRKPDGLIGIMDQDSAKWILDRVALMEVCGIGPRIKRRLNNMGIFNFKDLREAPRESLMASFKSYGKILHDFANGIDDHPIIPFYEKPEVKSIGHQYTVSKDINDPREIKQTLLKICELVARRTRSKKLEGKKVSLWFRYAFNLDYFRQTGNQFASEGMQCTIPYTSDGLEVFSAAWKSFLRLWNGDPVRLLAVSLGNVRPTTPANLSLLEEVNRREVITRALDTINNKYGEFTLQRATLMNSRQIKRMPNSFMSDRRFRLG